MQASAVVRSIPNKIRLSLSLFIYQYILIYKLYYVTLSVNLKGIRYMDVLLKTIGSINDETRVKILNFININKEVCVCDIENAFNMIQSRVSRHLKILKEAGFLKVDRRGRWAYYSIRCPLDEFRQSILKEIACLNLDVNKGCNIE